MRQKKRRRATISPKIRCELLSELAPVFGGSAMELRRAEQEIFDVYGSIPTLYADRLVQRVRFGTDSLFGIDAPEQGEQQKAEKKKKKKKGGFNSCRRCGSSDVVTDNRQTRSADEGMTYFSACQDCGHRWRTSG